MAADTRDEAAAETPASSTTSTEENKPETHAATDTTPNAYVLASDGKEVGVLDVLRTIRMSEFKELHMKPCVRESLLTGIGGGFGIGGIRAIWGGTVVKALAF